MSDQTPSDNNAQDDFWDLDDDDLNLDSEVASEAVAPEPEIRRTGPTPITDDGRNSPENESDFIEKNQSRQVNAPDDKATAVITSEKEQKSGSDTSLIEKISIAAVLMIFAAAIFWGLSAFFKNSPEGELVTFVDEFPLKGSAVTVQEVETWWREPIRTGDNADYGVVAESNLIPCARLKISDANSTVLRVTFRNGKKELIGDPTSLVVNNGTFEKSGTDEIVIHSTSGFENPSGLNAYTNGDIDPWTVVIIEGSEGGFDADPLVKARISAVHKEN